MCVRHAMLVTAAVLHLGLVICGGFRIVPVSRPAWLAEAIETYRAYSGANNGYGYFAPAVASEWRTEFEVCDSYPARCFEVSEPRPNREVTLLLSTIDGMFPEFEERELLAASWAAAQFARFPKATVVLVKPQVFIVPTMKAYRRGQRPHWRTGYVFLFRNPEHESR